MSDFENEDVGRDRPPRVLAELSAGYLLILGVMGILFGFATGIDVTTPWEVIGATITLWLVLSAAAIRKGKANRH